MAESVSRITSRIWLGDIRATGITHVVTALEVAHTTAAICNAGCKQFHVVPLHDRPDAPIYLWFQEVYDFIQTALDASPHNQVYIHCMAGISRSSTLLAAYLMRRHNMTADDAIAYIRDARPQIQPNPGFYGALKLWELNTQQTFARAAARELKETAPTE